MSTQPTPVKKHPDGLLYAVADGEATILGCTTPDAVHLDVPSHIVEEDAQYPVTAIGESAFSYLSALQTIALPPTLRRIGHGAFEYSGLSEVQLPDGLISLAPYAFFSCVRLSRVTLPAGGLDSLPEQVFGGCTALYRRGVTNLTRIRPEKIQRCGLQDLNKPITPAMPAAMPPSAGNMPGPVELLQRGMLLEEEGKHADAAIFYMQAHDLRAQVASASDLQARADDLRAITTAEYRLGVLLKLRLAPELNGDGSPRPSALELLHLACDTGDLADAMYHLGDLYAGGYSTEPNPAAALQYLSRAASIGHERACLDLAHAYLDGTLDHADSDTALQYLRRCAAFDGPYSAIATRDIALLEEADAMYQQMLRGDNGAAYTLYLLLRERPYALSKATAMDCLLKAADLMHPQAVDEMLAICDRAGDPASAYKWKLMQESLRRS